MSIDKVSPVKALVQEGLYLLMEPLGYTLEGHNLIRKISARPQGSEALGGAVEFIEFRIEAGATGRFTVNLGVHYPEVMQQILRVPGLTHLKAQLRPLQSSACAFQQNLAEVALGKARWWKIETGGPNLKKLVEELTILILEGGVPWFQARSQPLCLLQDPTRGDIFALMAASLSGDEAILREFWQRFQSQSTDQALVAQVEKFLWPA